MAGKDCLIEKTDDLHFSAKSLAKRLLGIEKRRMKTRTIFSRYKLLAYAWGMGVGALMAVNTVAYGAGYSDGTLDVSFGFGATLDVNSPPPDGDTSYGKILTTDVLGNTVAAGVGNIGWSTTATSVALSGVSFGTSPSKGFFHEATYGSGNGLILFEPNTASQTYGASNPLPRLNGTNRATFHDSVFTGGDLGQDATGVVGFLSSAGNWGYLEFDWIESSSTMTVLSAKVQRFTGQSITFTPSSGATESTPEPSSLLLLTMGLATMGRLRNR